MRYKVLLAVVFLVAMAAPHGSMAYDFSAVSPSGHTLYYNIVSNEAWVTYDQINYSASYYDLQGEVVVPSSVAYGGTTYPVTAIGFFAFQGCSGITSVVLPATITHIKDNSFDGCSGLDTINFPDSLTYIGHNAFKNCTSLTSITIPGGVHTIYNCAFQNCTSLTTAVINEGVGVIGNYVFNGCTNLDSVALPSSVSYIGEGAFGYCTSLTRIVLSNSITQIGRWAFRGCVALADLTLGHTIGMSVALMVGADAFVLCSNLTHVNYRGSIKDWSVIQFESPASNPLYYARHLYINNVEVVNAIIPGGYAYISDYTFINCSNLSTLHIPNSVLSVGESAFANCTGLMTIRSAADIPPSVSLHTFDSVPDSIPVIVPCGNTASYAAEWSHFTNFVDEDWFTFNARSSDTTQGTVEVLTSPDCTAPTAEVEAFPKEGYQFYYWNDGSTSNPYTLTVTRDMTLVAYFLPSTGVNGIDTDRVNVYTQGGDIVVEGADDRPVNIYDMTGRLLPFVHHSYPNGVYMVKVGNLPVKRVVVIR